MLMRRSGFVCKMAAVAMGAALVLSGCASGGGGASMVGPTTPPPPPPPQPPPPGPFPTLSSAEFQANYGLAAIHADAAFAAGGTGAGVTVGVVDTGVDPTQPDLIGAVSSQSTDTYAFRNMPTGSDPHATFVAGVIGARFNGFGSVGVAYQSTILSVRADRPGSCTSAANSCSFDDSALATGITYATAHGARVINLSIGGPGQDTPQFEQALSQAVAAGVVFAISSGNESAANPDFPAMYATDPRYVGSILAVGATTQAGVMASYSNKAGAAASDYVVAPGDNITTDCDQKGNCFAVSGTSFSAPHVAGALALLLQAFPNLSGKQALALLLQTTDDLGAPGVDPVYGAGLIDLAKAFQPVGTLSVPIAAGGAVAPSANFGSRVSTAFGDAVSRTNALNTVGYDSYRRLFNVNLASAYRPAPTLGQFHAQTPSGRQTSVSMTLSPGAHLDLTTSVAPVDEPTRDGLFAPGFSGQTRADINLTVTAGRFGLTAWNGQGGLPASADLAASDDPFAALAGSNHAIKAGYRLGAVSISGETGGGGPYSYLGYSNLKPSQYVLAGVTWVRGPVSATVDFGRLTEPQGPLGSFLPARAGFGLQASTQFLTGRVDWALNEKLGVSAVAGVGRTTAPGGVLELRQATSSTWSLVLTSRCARERSGCLRWSARVDQPIRIEQGLFTAALAQTPQHYGDPLIFSTRSFSAAPSRRQVNLSLGLGKSFGAAGDLDLRAVEILNDNNQAAAPLDLGVLATWASKFW